MEKILKYALVAGRNYTLADVEKLIDESGKFVQSLSEVPEEPPKFDGYTFLGNEGEEEFLYVQLSATTTVEISKAPEPKEEDVQNVQRRARILRPDEQRQQTSAIIPTCLLTDEEFLKKYFNLCLIDGRYYSGNDYNIITTKDTNQLTFKVNAKQCQHTGYWYSQKAKFRYIEHRNLNVGPDVKVVITEDMKTEDLAENVYHCRKDGKHYSFRELAPDYVIDERQPPRFNFTGKVEPKPMSIGLEFELEMSARLGINVMVDSQLKKLWYVERDGSLNETGSEFVSIPLGKDEFEKEVVKFMNLAKDKKADPNLRCGYHIHVGLQDFKHNQVVNLILLGKSIENSFFGLVAPHRRASRFCRRMDDRFTGFIRNEDFEKCGSTYYMGASNFSSRTEGQSKWAQNDARHYWMNIDRYFRYRKTKISQTVEFRALEATLDANQVINYTNMCWWIVKFAKDHDLESCRNASLSDVAQYSNDPRLIDYVNKSTKAGKQIRIKKGEKPIFFVNPIAV